MLWWMGTKCVGVVLLFLVAFLYKQPIDDDSKITEKRRDKIYKMAVLQLMVAKG